MDHHPDPHWGRARAPARAPARARPPAFGDALGRTERHLALVASEHGRAALHRWRARCPGLADAPVDRPAELPGWLHAQPAATANAVLGGLLSAAQAGDQLALVAVLACLAPGIRALARRARIPVDEALSEVALVAMTFPVQRRSAIAGGLLLDARNRLWRAARKQPAAEPLGDDTTHPVAPGDLGDTVAVPAAQRLVGLVCHAHRRGVLDLTDAELILRTRVAGHPVRPVAHHLGLTPTAAYQRRTRAESRLTEAIVDGPGVPR